MAIGGRGGEFVGYEEAAGKAGASRDRTIVKLSLPYARGKVCAETAVNLLLKIISVHSRVLPEGADTEFDP